MTKHELKLENWRLAVTRDGKFLIGECYGHPIIKDGSKVTTNPISSINEKDGVAETRTTIYRLGKRA